MPNTIPTTSYGWVVSDLRDLANDLDQIAYETCESISEVEATLCHFHLDKVLKSLRTSMSLQTLSLTTYPFT